MKKLFNHFHFSVLGAALLCVALGLAMLLRPGEAMKILCYGFGAVLVISGLLQIASYLLGERQSLGRKLLVISGIVSAVAGVWILLSPDKVLRLIGIVLGVVLLYHGFMDVKYGLDIKGWKGKGALAPVLFGLVTCGLGVLVLVNPFSAEKLLLTVMGVSFLFDGLTDCYTVFAVSHAGRANDRLSSAEPVIELEGAAAQVVEPAREIAEPAPVEVSSVTEPAEE